MKPEAAIPVEADQRPRGGDGAQQTQCATLCLLTTTAFGALAIVLSRRRCRPHLARRCLQHEFSVQEILRSIDNRVKCLRIWDETTMGCGAACIRDRFENVSFIFPDVPFFDHEI